MYDFLIEWHKILVWIPLIGIMATMYLVYRYNHDALLNNSDMFSILNGAYHGISLVLLLFHIFSIF